MGEQDRRSVVWDYIAVYPAGAIWKDRPPQALYEGGPVVRVTDPARAALAQALQGNPAASLDQWFCVIAPVASAKISGNGRA
jgi:hypothetical protein